MYLTLPVPSNRPVFLSDCLSKYVETEILDGDDAWNCPNCKIPRKSSKQLTVSKLPTILLIHLKRFHHEGPFRNKVETYVDFPLQNLDFGDGHLYDLYAVSVC